MNKGAIAGASSAVAAPRHHLCASAVVPVAPANAKARRATHRLSPLPTARPVGEDQQQRRAHVAHECTPLLVQVPRLGDTLDAATFGRYSMSSVRKSDASARVLRRATSTR